LSGVKFPELHPVSWAYDLIDGKVVSGENQTMILTGMYSLWLQRNKWRHGEQSRPTSEAVRWAMDLAYDLWNMSAMVDGAETSSVTGSHTQRWECPPEGWLKCNADGTFYENQWQGATGAVLRDEAGGFVRGRAKWYGHCLDALSMEALACRDGLLLARQVGAQRLWLETDSQELLKLWRAGDNQRSSIAPILGEIRELSSLFLDFKFSSISRNCNRVAHSLAKQVTRESQVGWWQQTPTCVATLLVSDCNSGT